MWSFKRVHFLLLSLKQVCNHIFLQPISRTKAIMKQRSLPVLKIGYNLVTACPHFTPTCCTKVVMEFKVCLVITAIKILQDLLE